MADYNQCLKNAKIIDPNARLCAQWFCDTSQQQAQITLFCHCKPPYPPQNPCPYAGNSPVGAYDKDGPCFCCCSCFAYGTAVAGSRGEYRAIETFAVLDSVLAAGGDLQWKELTVEFSQGVRPDPTAGKTMMSVFYGDAASPRSLVVTPDHVFLLANGKLRRAEKLVPGDDKLVDPQGNPVELLRIETGGWWGGVHHIATTKTVAVSLEGHLLDSNGVVTGDWALQILDLEGGALDGILEQAEGAPGIATNAYREAYPQHAGETFAAGVPDAQVEGARNALFRPYGRQVLQVPDDACTFISRRQAESILGNPTTPQRPVTSTAGQEAVYYLFKLYHAFYPDVHFDLQWEELLPNAYSWQTFGVKIVVLSGGLVRTPGITFPGLALVLAHEIGHLYGGAPLVPDTQYSCEGQADYAATSAVMRGSFYPAQYPATIEAALAEIRGFFDLIDPALRKGKPDATCQGISTNCRLDAMEAGKRLDALPACAGGPSIDFLEVRWAVGSAGPGTEPEVRVQFNLPVDAATAEDTRHWVFTPQAEVASAAVDPADLSVVRLVVPSLDPAAEYRLSVTNVLSTDGLSIQDGYETVSLYWE